MPVLGKKVSNSLSFSFLELPPYGKKSESYTQSKHKKGNNKNYTGAMGSVQAGVQGAQGFWGVLERFYI